MDARLSDQTGTAELSVSTRHLFWRVLVLLTVLWLLTLAVFWQGYRHATQLLMAHHREMAVAHARAIQSDFTQLFADQHRIIRTVLQDHETDLRRLVRDPDDADTEERLRALLNRLFPTLFAFSIVDPRSGEFLLVGDALDGRIEQICYADTRRFIAHPEEDIIRVHPNLHHHHYDLYTHIRVAGQDYVIFTSFTLQRLQQTLKRFVTPGHELLVVLHDPRRGDLIEFTSHLTREQIEKAGLSVFIRPEDHAMRTLSEASIPHTRWRVVERATPTLMSQIHRQAGQPYLLAGTVFTLLYWVLAGLLLRQLRREQHLLVQLHQLTTRLQHLSLHDGLTGLCNRRCFDRTLDQLWALAQRTGQPLCLLMLDIDHFKRINDTHGHQAGDRVLQTIASILRRHVQRSSDLIARYGGEEIAVLLPDTPLEGACALAEKLRQAVEQTPFTELEHPVTVSIGVACHIPKPDDAPAQLIRQADMNLYAAKEAGRNRVICARVPQPDTPQT